MTTKEMTDEEKQVVTMVRDFVKRDIEPVASEMDHADAYPFEIVEKMKELGLFGCTIGEEYGGMGLNSFTYAKVIEEITAGWMSVAGIINSHLIMAHIVELFGEEDQKRHFLPKMATAEFRGGIALTEPNCGSDVAAIQTSAVRDGDDYVVNGTKMLITNGEHGDTFAVLAKTDKEVQPPYKGISCFIMQKGGSGFTHGRHLEKLGYRGIDTTELIFDDFHVPAGNLIGRQEGQGFKQMMTGLELGRINVGRPRRGRRARRFREVDGLRPEAPYLRRPHRAAPGDPDQARRHVYQDRSRAAPRRAGLRQEGRRRALRLGSGRGQALRQRDGDGSLAGGAPRPRWRRLHQGGRRRAILP